MEDDRVGEAARLAAERSYFQIPAPTVSPDPDNDWAWGWE